MKSEPTLLIVAASEASADLLYITRFYVPDEMIWFRHQGKSYAVLSPLEIDRARATAEIDVCLASDELIRRLQGRAKKKSISPEELLIGVLQSKSIRSVAVPASFPLHYARALEKVRIRVQVVHPFFPQREIKTSREIQGIARGQGQAEAGLERGLEVLKSSTIDRQKKLRWGGQILTSERLRGEIDSAVIKAGGLPAHTIVAGGNQACDPHERGSGPLKANQSIILDIFPRDQTTGYYGDLTRSVVRGKAPEALRQLHNMVASAQRMVLQRLREGADGAALHDRVKAFFTQAGYLTEKKKGRWVGFFHGTGHSLGLEIHEAPRFAAGILKAGHVMTVEPGLYYPGVGGVRIEDLVVIRKKGVTNLTQAPDVFEV
jgi:Xaa-Pro aminopeptidase